VQRLHLSEDEACRRIAVARVAVRFPVVLELLAEGALHITGISLLANHLTAENCEAVLREARFKTKKEIEKLVVRLHPLPPAPTLIRGLPVREPASASLPAPERIRPVVKPLSPEHYKIQFTASAATHDKLRRAQDLLRHVFPNGDPAAIIDRALALLIADLEKKKFAETERPRATREARPGSRHIPAGERREVAKRGDGRCTFVSAEGHRCSETGRLEIHHKKPSRAADPPWPRTSSGFVNYAARGIIDIMPTP